MKLIYLSALDAKVVGKTGSLVRSKVLQNGGEYSKSFLFEQCSRDKAKLRAAVILLENEPDKENEDECYGEEIEELLDVILSGAVLSDDEMAYVYHNITLLLKEYNRIVWRANNSDDRALRLLSCETEDEMLEITSKDEKYRQAYLIVEYIKFINGAIEMVKSFPVNGKEYYDIIKTIVDLKPQNISDEVSSRELGMSTYTYSVKKRRALSVLSSILWGCDGDAFVRLLTDAA